MKCLSMFFCVFLFGVSCASKNVLILDTAASPSHQVWMHSLTRAVADRGYNVTTLTCKGLGTTLENLHTLIVDGIYNVEVPDEQQINYLDLTNMNPWQIFFMFNGMMDAMGQIVLKSPHFKALFDYPEHFKFDQIIYDYLGPVAAVAALADRYPEAQLIGACAYPGIDYTDKLTGAPHMASFAPSAYTMGPATNLDSFWGRLQNFLIYAFNDFMIEHKYYPEAEKVGRSFGLKRSIREIISSTRLLLVNHSPVMDIFVPILPNIIPVGGLQIGKPTTLPSDIEEIYKSAKAGVIFFSLGSNVQPELLGVDMLNKIVAALAQFPEYNIIWKIDLSTVELQLPKNVFVKDWLPQNDILADNRTKLFISHAGGLSTQESTWHGVPMLAIPVMSDQFPNAMEAVASGMALQLDIRALTTDEMTALMRELLTNPKYLTAAKLRSRNFQDQKESPMERALWWIDYVARNGDVSFLRNQKMEEMNFFAKHSVDVIVFLTAVLVIFAVLVIKCMRICCCKSHNRKMKEKVKHL